jgi:hypothetical protein
MPRLAIIVGLSLIATGSALAKVDPWADRLCKLEASVPADASGFMSRYAMCAHWGGEEPYDAERREEIERAVRELTCDRLDADEAGLRKRYAANAKVLAALDVAKEEDAWPACKRGQPA